MEIHHTVAALRQRLSWASRVVFVPTMGNLHEGHLELVRLARLHGDCVVVSIFVNPLQFGPNEDFARYPRTFAEDCAKLEGLADVVFAPEVGELYPVEQSVFVEPPPLAAELCGAFRPGHFRGVATVVLKLFNIVQPAAAVFGKKDYQQLAVIRALTEQLNLPIEIVAAETSRAEDNLALSSRNGYLSKVERGEAVRLYRNLAVIRSTVLEGGRDYPVLEQAARADLEKHGWKVDYIALRSATTLTPPTPDESRLVVLGAAWLGRTRLIDNLEISLR